MPDVYGPVIRDGEPQFTTRYQVFTGKRSLFDNEQGPKLRDIMDGAPNTLMLAEAGTPVPWTKPEDIVVDNRNPLPELGRQFNGKLLWRIRRLLHISRQRRD